MTVLRTLKEIWSTQEKLRFLVVGAYNTLFGYGAFALLYLGLHRRLHYLAILVLAHVISVCNAFVGHRSVTFRVEGSLMTDFLRFNLSYLGVLLLGLAAMPIMVEKLHIHPLASNAVLILITTITSYVMHKRISFRR